jgi:lipid-binding SYLF domain-containing protein
MQAFHTAPVFVFALLFAVPAFAQSDEQKLVADARTTLSNFMRDPAQTWIHDNIGRAKAILIAPQIVKAGFIFGGSGGRAVLVARNGRTWVGPAFYNLATASVMTDRGLNSLMASTLKIGGDASIAAGPVGAGAKSTVTADLVSFTRAKGVYGGLNLDGTVVNTNIDWNDAYYGAQNVLPPDILVSHKFKSGKSTALLNEVARIAGK